jgi:adenylate cyclase
MKHFLIFTITLITLCSGNLYARLQGQALADSLLKELPKQKDDTNKVNLLYALSYSYSTLNQQEGIKYGQLGLELSTNLNWEKGTESANYALGVNYLQKSDFPQAMEHYLKALKTGEELKDKKGIATITSNIGLIYYEEEDYLRALEYFRKALALSEACNDKRGVAIANGNIGEVYYKQADYPKAFEYNVKALKLFDELGEKRLIAQALCFIGEISKDQKNYPLALGYFQSSLSVANEIGHKSIAASDLVNIGSLYLSIIEDTPSRSRPAGSSILNERKVNEGFELTEGKYRSNVSIPASKPALLSGAFDFLRRGLAICKQLNEPDIMQPCYEGLAKAYKLAGDYKAALDATDKWHAIKDSVFSKENKEKIIRLGIRNEYDRRRLTDSLKTAGREKIGAIQLKKQKTFTYLGIAGIMLLAGFSFFIVKERSKSEAERKKSDDLLLNILPGEVAYELKTRGTTTARLYDNVTVLFTDFVNFTSAAERMSPQGLIDELHTCFKAFDEITGRYNIEKIKTIGDAYLAVSGLPTPEPKHAEHIVKAAIEMNNFTQARLAKLGERTFQVRIGIHSGSVVAGIVGVKKFAYDIWGDTVNTAARMEQNSEAGKINISQTTYELVKDKVTCSYRGEIDAKGKGQLKMYYVS